MKWYCQSHILYTMSNIESVSRLESWLGTYLNFEKLPQKNIFWLDTIQFLCSRFENPQNCAPAVHIAGSKGKGSVSEMISSILEEYGLYTGLYTSPHIIDFTERIGTAHAVFPTAVYDDSVRELMDGIKAIPVSDYPGERPLTWFELVTLFAFLCFRRAHIAYGVYEVGLGGRLDATNVLLPRICAITPIELEHTQFLGSTVEKIAGEKAGIIKKEVPVIIASQKESVRKVFRSKAEQEHAPVFFVDELLKKSTFSYSVKKDCVKNHTHSSELYNSIGMHIHLESDLFNRPVETILQMPGEFQVQNAALASFAVKKLLPDIDETVIENGLAKAVLPGRFETVHPRHTGWTSCVILDGAHTVNSIRFTVDTLNACIPAAKVHLLFACAADKDVEDIAVLLKDRFSKVTLTRPGSIKQSDTQRMKKAFTAAGIGFTYTGEYVQAVQNSLEAAGQENAVLLVTGSFYLVSEVKKVLACC